MFFLVSFVFHFSVLWATSIGSSVNLTVPSNAPLPLLESFVSFAIEFSSFPAFAGNSSYPNLFSYQLISNIGKIQGTNPVVRVGGNTQDYAVFNASQVAAIDGRINPALNADYPTTVSIGPSFFDSYSTWPNVTFIHGFNLATNGTVGLDSLISTATLACQALSGGKLAYWELGNEPDLYTTSSQGHRRPSSWNEQDYVNEWLNKSAVLKNVITQTCPYMIENGKFQFIAPSFWNPNGVFDPVTTWNEGLDTNDDIAMISGHNYMAGAGLGATLQGSLMNHLTIVSTVDQLMGSWNKLSYTEIPFMIGECNSLFNAGELGITNTFGAALWTFDYNLYAATQGVKRIHMQQGLNFRYGAWQPITTNISRIATKAPYYGSIAVAQMMGDLATNKVRIVEISLDANDPYESAYAAYANGQLARIAVIQMKEFNYTGVTTGPRPNETFTFQLPSSCGVQEIGIQRLMANGSNSLNGITFDGYSYAYDLDQGKPVLLSNVTRGETISIGDDCRIQFEIPWSSAAILTLA